MTFAMENIRAYMPHPLPWLLPLDLRQIGKALAAMNGECARQGRRTGGIEAILVHDAAIARLNARFMACSGPTNVLSFPSAGDGPGFMAVSLNCLNREAEIYGQRPDIYLLRLLAHGTAHLTGLEHGPDMDSLCEQELGAVFRAHGFAGMLEKTIV